MRIRVTGGRWKDCAVAITRARWDGHSTANYQECPLRSQTQCDMERQYSIWRAFMPSRRDRLTYLWIGDPGHGTQLRDQVELQPQRAPVY